MGGPMRMRNFLFPLTAALLALHALAAAPYPAVNAAGIQPE